MSQKSKKIGKKQVKTARKEGKKSKIIGKKVGKRGKINIILVGFMGTGKTSVGVRLAEILKMQFVDTDDLIESDSKKPISDIFSQMGEEYFRAKESSIIESVSRLDNQVIATGGGAVKREININNLKSNGIIFCLYASPEIILQRTSGESHRPLLQVDDPISRIKEMLKEREPFYAKADYIIDTSDLTIEQVVEKIQDIFVGVKMTKERLNQIK